MSQVVLSLLPVLGLSALLGMAAGWVSGLPRDRVGLIVAGSLTFLLVTLSALALSQTVPGAAGLWVETASLMLAAYLAGCLTGGLGKAVLARKA